MDMPVAAYIAASILLILFLYDHYYRQEIVVEIPGSPDREDEGHIKTIHGDEKSLVDIVCVHGLGGDATGTWTASTSQRTDVNWLKDFLPVAVPEARIITFGYKPRLLGSQNLARKTLLSHSNGLLRGLTAHRPGEAERRPIIFVGHSFGGLIIKSALLESSTSIETKMHLKSIQLSTVGALYFGTPHQAAPHDAFEKSLKRLVEASPHGTFEKQLKKTLRQQSESLRQQLDSFKGIESDISTYAFFESQKKHKHGTEGSDGDLTAIVPRATACPDYCEEDWFRKFELDRTHTNLVRFKSASEKDYEKVVHCIRLCVRIAPKAERNWKTFERGSPDTLQIFIDKPKPKRVNSFNLNFIDKSEKTRLQIEEKNHLQARAQLEEELRSSEMKNGLSDSKTLRIVANLASNYAQLGDFATARFAYQRLLMAAEQKEGRWHPSMMPILRDMASACQQQGNYAEAEKYMRHLLKIQDQLLTPEAPVSVRAAAAKNLATFAILLDLQGKFTDSEFQHIKVVQMRESSLGYTHDETLKAVENLGHNYRNQKKYPRAISIYQEALERRLRGPEWKLSQVLSTASKLAEVFEKIGKRAEAERIRAHWRRRAALRGCWPDPESNLAHELQPITPKTKFGTQKRCWATSSTGSAFEKFSEVCPLLNEVLVLDAEVKKGRKAGAPKVSYTCCMVGFSPDAVRPAIVLHCQQIEICRAAEDRLASTPGWKDWSEANPMFLLLIAESALKKLPDSPETP